MTKLLLTIHIVAVGIWLGCVLTEALFERALLGKGREQELLLAGLHKRVDLAVEIPAFVIVLITGLLMFRRAEPSTLLHVKIGFGLLAVTANAYCVWVVFRRLAHAHVGNWSAFERVDKTQHKIGAVVLVGILIALAIGIYLHANA
jgi:uncharacterized membrane protein